VAALDYQGLEKQAAGIVYEEAGEGDNTLLKAVAEAVAEAGPWNASMEMVARRSGLSKSGLYAHFKNKQDMIDKLFITEFTRIANVAKAQIETAEGSEEQLYLAILSIVNYLRARPEIFEAIDWIKTRRLELGEAVSDRLSEIIQTIKIQVIQQYDRQSLVWIAQWIIFLIVNTLAWWSSPVPWNGQLNKNTDWAKNLAEVPIESFRVLFRFIALGAEGLQG
jgi:AcrR family transcriptional regulator